MKQSLKSFSASINFSNTIANSTGATTAFVESNINYNSQGVLGQESQSHYSEFLVGSKNTESAKGYAVAISCNCPVFKLHFSLLGSYSHQTNNDLVVTIPEGCCNLFFLPLQPSKDIFTSKHTRTLEVFFTQSFLERILGEQRTANLLDMTTAIDAEVPFVFFKERRQIPLKLSNQIKEILNCAYTGSLKKNYIESRITILLLDFLMDTTKLEVVDTVMPEADYAAIVKVEEYCRLNLKQKLTINTLSQIAGFNTTKLKRDFKKIYKTTIFKYITQLRMENAKQLILEKGYSIAEVSYEVGYSNPQHFTTAFKKTMGYLPSQLIK
ncbi:AraC family transcriptional regulator [Cellulophaga sp. 20_2_10]|uniref:helix-turn-helix domain-containing protein n=1 Tax=Cellulophaga sp. 20_2_10 TaxID=2942476 RepID=UPI00201AD4AF|nr:AraC family transcriptional regulator [Cellulophaga sp. 20_2_10]MCL5245175.1 AraC family transcriptional regulator [Cellulophaga sp. 20_2_10]